MSPEVLPEYKEMAAQYLAAANEDLGVLEYIRKEDYVYSRNACQLAARYSEKVIKAKLLLMGVDVRWTHDQVVLLQNFPDSPERSKAIEYAAILTPYASKANYPSIISEMIDREEACEAYAMAIEMPYLIGLYKRS